MTKKRAVNPYAKSYTILYVDEHRRLRRVTNAIILDLNIDGYLHFKPANSPLCYLIPYPRVRRLIG